MHAHYADLCTFNSDHLAVNTAIMHLLSTRRCRGQIIKSVLTILAELAGDAQHFWQVFSSVLMNQLTEGHHKNYPCHKARGAQFECFSRLLHQDALKHGCNKYDKIISHSSLVILFMNEPRSQHGSWIP